MHINSTVRGFLGNIIFNLILIAGYLTIVMFLNSYLTGQLDKLGIGSIWEVNDILDFDTPFPLFAYVAKWLLYLFIASGAYAIAHTILYDSRQTNQLSDDGKNWSKIEKRQYSFPAARKTDTAVINRVTEVEVSESTIDRIFGTGSLRLTLTVFLNATEAQMKWKIPAIEDPHRVAEEIRSKSLDHDGARVHTTLIPRDAKA